MDAIDFHYKPLSYFMHLDTLFWERNTENPPERYNQQNPECGKVYITNELFLQK